MSSLLLSPASVANSASIAHQGIATHTSPRLRYESGRSLQRSPVRVSFLSPRQASVRVELGRSAGPEHPQVQPHISCHPRRAPLASNQEKDRLQDCPYGPSLLGWCCAGIPDGTVPLRWLSRRSTMSLVGFSWWPRCSEVSASDIRPSGLRCLRPPNLELSSAQDQTIAWQFIAFQTETESASVSAVLSASVDPYLMKGLISFLYYYY